MANNRRKSAAIALAVIGIAGLSLASASTLDLTSGTVQAGVTNLTDCQKASDGAIAVSFGSQAYAASGYTVGSVKLDNVAAACSGNSVRITVLDGSATPQEVTGTLGASGVFTATLTTAVSAHDLTGAAVVISD